MNLDKERTAAKAMHCDRCNAIWGLYQHATGYRCAACIWKERETLVEAVERLTRNTYTSDNSGNWRCNECGQTPEHHAADCEIGMLATALAKVKT